MEALEQLSVTPSNASSGQVKKAAGRLQKRIHPGILFPLPPHKDSLPEFSWPLHPTKRTEDEVAGYPTALDFVSDHCMPTSLTAMLKEEDSFLEWWVLPTVIMNVYHDSCTCAMTNALGRGAYGATYPHGSKCGMHAQPQLPKPELA